LPGASVPSPSAGPLGSWSGTVAYDALGWWGTVGLCLSMSSLVCFLSYRQRRHGREAAGRAA
ncbi:MAG: hypothetical protein AAGL66_15780, partial [Pseudomonadota bacterium]